MTDTQTNLIPVKDVTDDAALDNAVAEAGERINELLKEPGQFMFLKLNEAGTDMKMVILAEDQAVTVLGLGVVGLVGQASMGPDVVAKLPPAAALPLCQMEGLTVMAKLLRGPDADKPADAGPTVQ